MDTENIVIRSSDAFSENYNVSSYENVGNSNFWQLFHMKMGFIAPFQNVKWLRSEGCQLSGVPLSGCGNPTLSVSWLACPEGRAGGPCFLKWVTQRGVVPTRSASWATKPRHGGTRTRRKCVEWILEPRLKTSHPWQLMCGALQQLKPPLLTGFSCCSVFWKVLGWFRRWLEASALDSPYILLEVPPSRQHKMPRISTCLCENQVQEKNEKIFSWVYLHPTHF